VLVAPAEVANAAALEADRLRAEIARLLAEAERSRERIAELEAALSAREKTESEAAAKAAAAAGPAGRRGGRSLYQLASLGDADAICDQALDRGDLESLWILGLSLLVMGEEGYDKLLELFAQMTESTESKRVREAFEAWGDSSEMLAGRFLRDLFDHQEDVLKFMLHLNGRDPESMPQPLRSMREDFLREVCRDAGPFVFGFCDADNPEIQDGYASLYENMLEGDLAQDQSRARNVIQSLAQLRGEAATDVLLRLLDRAPPSLAPHVVLALGFQGNRRALPVIEGLLATATEGDLARALSAAIKLLK
jgi:hypothetical protein